MGRCFSYFTQNQAPETFACNPDCFVRHLQEQTPHGLRYNASKATQDTSSRSATLQLQKLCFPKRNGKCCNITQKAPAQKQIPTKTHSKFSSFV